MIENTTVIHLDVPLLGLTENVDVTTKLISADLK